MKFFDRKEEVIDIQLTQYGKHLLSKGKFKPVYYEFFDDDLLYDIEYGNRIEIQNNSEDRIKETPRLQVQYVFSDREREHKRILEEVRSKNQNVTDIPAPILQDRTYFLSAPLGNSNLRTEYAPSWNVKVEEGEISGSVEPLLSSLVSFIKIPQINMKEISFYASVGSRIPSGNEEGAAVSRGDLEGNVHKLTLVSSEYEDGTYIDIKGSGILLTIEEENTFFEKENFEIEVFRVKEVSGSKNELTPLSFVKKPKRIVNNILLDDEEVKKSVSEEIDETFVEYYFDLFVDDEIIEPERIKKKINLYDNKVTKEDGPFGDKCDEE
jgi:hypothetical protein